MNSKGVITETKAGGIDKRSAAANSVIAAIFLTGMKLVVGIMTGSLGILAEAAHSGLDLVAAVVTFMAVHFSDSPADREHPYGHGKIENFSALIETVLLFATCAWIIYEAVQRLFFHPKESRRASGPFSSWPSPSPSMSAALRCSTGPPAPHHSQALEADALHFHTDIWSSSVVIGGLVLVWVGHVLPQYSNPGQSGRSRRPRSRLHRHLRQLQIGEADYLCPPRLGA